MNTMKRVARQVRIYVYCISMWHFIEFRKEKENGPNAPTFHLSRASIPEGAVNVVRKIFLELLPETWLRRCTLARIDRVGIWHRVRSNIDRESQLSDRPILRYRSQSWFTVCVYLAIDRETSECVMRYIHISEGNQQQRRNSSSSILLDATTVLVTSFLITRETTYEFMKIHECNFVNNTTVIPISIQYSLLFYSAIDLREIVLVDNIIILRYVYRLTDLNSVMKIPWELLMMLKKCFNRK